jgi:uncharacterized protein (DUF433 family)
MWRVLEPWQLQQLQRLAAADPERVETVLNTLWNGFPELFRDLATAAVDQQELSVDRCASLLDVEPEAIEERLEAVRKRELRVDHAVVHDELGNVARLAECRVAVWEVVREFRKLGSVERLTEAFPWLSTGELAAALGYAEQNPAEIEDQISQYESVLEKRRAEYPFAR